jgi:large subunit ribosomal protein L21
MYAVVKIKSQQFRVTPDTTLQVPLLADEVGATLSFDEVLMLSDGTSIKVGNPIVAGAAVKAEVLAHGLSRKIVIFKKRRRKNYRRKTGHRQPFTQIRITGITG